MPAVPKSPGASVPGLAFGSILWQLLQVRTRPLSSGAAGAVAAPVHGTVARHAAQALRGHGALHGMEDRLHGLARDDVEQLGDEGAGIVDRLAVRVAEVPGQAVEVAEHVAARAGGVAV